MGDEKREFTFEDAVICGRMATPYLHDVDLSRGRSNCRCTCASPNSKSKKLLINFEEGWFNCPKCKARGKSPVSLFMHVTGITDSKEAAREMHKLLGDDGKASFKPLPVVEKKPAPKTFDVADIEVRDRTYRMLLSLLVLSLEHRNSLIARGLTEEQIDLLGYKSLPRDRKAFCKKLLQKGCILEGVPGFYKDSKGDWTMNIFGSGIFIPWKNAKDQIQFLQIRKDKAEPVCKNCDHCDSEGNCSIPGHTKENESVCSSFKERGMRYFTLSSPDRECGTGARTWVHARKGRTEGWKEVAITEGALKADVASALSGMNFLAVAGVGNTGDLPRALHDLYYAGLEKVYLCYDNEPDNTAVLNGEEQIKQMLQVLRIPYQKVSWSELDLKGIDDWLKESKK